MIQLSYNALVAQLDESNCLLSSRSGVQIPSGAPVYAEKRHGASLVS